MIAVKFLNGPIVCLPLYDLKFSISSSFRCPGILMTLVDRNAPLFDRDQQDEIERRPKIEHGPHYHVARVRARIEKGHVRAALSSAFNCTFSFERLRRSKMSGDQVTIAKNDAKEAGVSDSESSE